MKKILATILTLCMIATFVPTFTAMAASDFAGEVPTSAAATKTQFEYLLSKGNVGITSANIEEAASYAQVTTGDAWKFANQSGMENYSFNGATGITLRTNVADMGNGANVVFALYVPKAGNYTFEYSSITRDNSGSLDIYFAKCPADFTTNSAGATLPFAESDKIADDLSFYVGGTNVRGYLALDEVVEVPEAGTYLVAFTDFKTVSGVDYDSSNLGSGDIGKIRQEIIGIRLTQTFGGEVPANATIDTEYNYVFGHDYVGLSAGADVNGATSYSKVTNTTATDYWKFAGKSDMANTTLNNNNNGVFINTNNNSSYMIMALYIPSAGKYNVSFDYLKRTDNCTLDMYFAKCPDAFTTSSASFPFNDSDKIAEDCSFGNGDPWSRGNVLDGVVEVPSAGTYLIGFTDSRINGAAAATNLTLYNIKLTREEEPVVPENPNEEIADKDVSIALTAIANGTVSPDAKALLSESTVTAGNVNSVTVGSTVTLKAEDSDTLKFLYWYNGNSGRMISDAATYTFTAGTNTPIYAKYADVNGELEEYFSAAGQLMEKNEGEFNAEPDRKLGNYYKLFKDKTAGIVSTLVNKIASAADFICWKKDGKVVSYDETYSFYTWPGAEDAVEVTEGEKSDIPAVVLFENNGAYMLELVNFDGVEIIEKGILFGGNLTVSSCAEKAVAVEDKNQFTASPLNESTARAYVIYRDGATIRVAYSK